MAARRALAAAVVRAWGVLAAALLVACAPLRGPAPAAAPFHLTAVAGQGDPARRASTRLVLQGLDADADGLPDSARSSYERALQVDPSNPWIYLALARQQAEGSNPARALAFLDQCEALLRSQGELAPGVEAHLDGLRGIALMASGREAEGRERLERARELAPEVWSDGVLDAYELR